MGEVYAASTLDLRESHLEDLELVEVEGFQLVKVLRQQEPFRLERVVLHEDDHLPELARNHDIAIEAVVVPENGTPQDADAQVVDVGVFEDSVLEATPQPATFALVEAVHLRGDVGEEE